jgi:hypothetical protein
MTMNWQSQSWRAFHNRGEILRTVIATADDRQDGILPMDVVGVAETFDDELALLGALQLRWHTRLAGRIDRELMNQPMDLEQAVVNAWRGTRDELPGVRLIVDHYRSEPTDAAMAEAMAKATAKEQIMLAAMSGRSSVQDAAAARVGEEIEHRARAAHGPGTHRADTDRLDTGANEGLLGRIKAVLAA